MKTRTTIILASTVLAILLIGAFVLDVFSAPPRLRAKAYWKPNTYDIANPVPQPWNVWLHFASNDIHASDLDASSILLEGVFAPMGAPYDLPGKSGSWVVVPFNGFDVLAVAIAEAGHMVPEQSYLVFLTITGQTIDGTPFSTENSGVVVLFDPPVSPP
jgi:hypothetical protein